MSLKNGAVLAPLLRKLESNATLSAVERQAIKHLPV